MGVEGCAGATGGVLVGAALRVDAEGGALLVAGGVLVAAGGGGDVEVVGAGLAAVPAAVGSSLRWGAVDGEVAEGLEFGAVAAEAAIAASELVGHFGLCAPYGFGGVVGAAAEQQQEGFVAAGEAGVGGDGVEDGP